MSIDMHKKMTRREADAIFENLDPSVIVERYTQDVALSARQAVRRYYPQLMAMRHQGLTYAQLCEFLAEALAFKLTPRTLREYMNAAKALDEASRSMPRSRKASGRQSPPIVPTVASTPIENLPAAIVPTLASPPIAPPIQPTSASTALPIEPATQVAPVVEPSGTDRSDQVLAFATEAELEAALVIPGRFDQPSIRRFQAALKQIRTKDIERYQALYAAAVDAGINVTNGSAPPMPRSLMF